MSGRNKSRLVVDLQLSVFGWGRRLCLSFDQVPIPSFPDIWSDLSVELANKVPKWHPHWAWWAWRAWWASGMENLSSGSTLVVALQCFVVKKRWASWKLWKSWKWWSWWRWFTDLGWSLAPSATSEEAERGIAAARRSKGHLCHLCCFFIFVIIFTVIIIITIGVRWCWAPLPGQLEGWTSEPISMSEESMLG